MIELKNILNNRAYPESGAILYNILCQTIEDNCRVEIDLDGVVSLPSIFLNASYGKAVALYGVEKVKQSTRFHHISKAQAERLKEYFERFCQFQTVWTNEIRKNLKGSKSHLLEFLGSFRKRFRGKGVELLFFHSQSEYRLER